MPLVSFSRSRLDRMIDVGLLYFLHPTKGAKFGSLSTTIYMVAIHPRTAVFPIKTNLHTSTCRIVQYHRSFHRAVWEQIPTAVSKIH